MSSLVKELDRAIHRKSGKKKAKKKAKKKTKKKAKKRGKKTGTRKGKVKVVHVHHHHHHGAKKTKKKTTKKRKPGKRDFDRAAKKHEHAFKHKAKPNSQGTAAERKAWGHKMQLARKKAARKR